MPKRLSERERIVGYAMNSTEDQLQDAIETFKAIQASRFPRVKKPATGRKNVAKQPVKVPVEVEPDPHAAPF